MAAKEMVTVGCKLPHGIWMELDQEGKPKTKILAKGCNSSSVIGGFGITENVPKDFFDKWLERHKEMKFVKRGQVWSYQSTEGARKKALEMAEIKHGVERLDPNRLPAGLEETEDSKKNRLKNPEQQY